MSSKCYFDDWKCQRNLNAQSDIQAEKCICKKTKKNLVKMGFGEFNKVDYDFDQNMYAKENEYGTKCFARHQF